MIGDLTLSTLIALDVLILSVVTVNTWRIGVVHGRIEEANEGDG